VLPESGRAALARHFVAATNQRLVRTGDRRVQACEVLRGTVAVRDGIASGAGEAELRRLMREGEAGMWTLPQTLAALVGSGAITEAAALAALADYPTSLTPSSS